MKALGIIVVAVVIGFLGYQVAYPKFFGEGFFPKERTEFTETKTAQPEAPKVATKKAEEPKPAPVVASTTPKEEPKPEMAPKPEEPKPEPKPETPPAMATTGGLGEATKKEEDPNAFHPPVFPPLDDVVKGWKEIPKKVFPRPVKLLKEVEFVMPIGKSKVGPGGMAWAVDQEGDNLVVSPTETSPAHSQVPLSDTDLKETMSQAYENWKVAMVEYKRKQFEFRKNAASRATEAPTGKKGGPAVASNDKPERAGDGSYPLLLASMKAGQVTEITPTNVKKWGEATSEKIEGKNYWTVIVNYTTKTMFGDFDTEAQARILNGKVEKWVYTGSGEVVP
jgi:hypothetical protein